jgi:hypothetical protein
MAKKKPKIQPKKHHFVFIAILIVMGFVGVASVLSGGADAATPNSLYSYDFRGVTTGVVPNRAATNGTVNLNLQGTWSPASVGAQFTGDLVGSQSAGWARPTTVPTINLKAPVALAFGVAFTYQAPINATCFKDSPNLTQIGRFGNLVTQAKLQLSNCGKNKLATYVQCRIAGGSTPSTVTPVTNTQALVNGASYIATCAKSPTPSGQTQINLQVTRIDSVAGNYVVGNSFTQPATGIMRSTQYLSVANKYPLAAPDKNSDQYSGVISKVAYCKGNVYADALTCLNAELPVPTAL